MKCKKCDEEMGEMDRGKYYAGICNKCCDEFKLCVDCGQPRNSIVGACSGGHGDIFQIRIAGDANPFGQVKMCKCPKCGHEFQSDIMGTYAC